MNDPLDIDFSNNLFKQQQKCPLYLHARNRNVIDKVDWIFDNELFGGAE